MDLNSEVDKRAWGDGVGMVWAKRGQTRDDSIFVRHLDSLLYQACYTYLIYPSQSYSGHCGT